MLLMKIITLLGFFRQAFRESTSFYWFCLFIIFFCIHQGHMFLTAMIRRLGLKGTVYDALRKQFKTKDKTLLEKIKVMHVKFTFENFKKSFYRSKGRMVLVIDGTKQPKEGRKIPGAHLQHSSSQSIHQNQNFFMGFTFKFFLLWLKMKLAKSNIPKELPFHHS